MMCLDRHLFLLTNVFVGEKGEIIREREREKKEWMRERRVKFMENRGKRRKLRVRVVQVFFFGE